MSEEASDPPPQQEPIRQLILPCGIQHDATETYCVLVPAHVTDIMENHPEDAHLASVLWNFYAFVCRHDRGQAELLTDDEADAHAPPVYFACVQRSASPASVFTYFEMYKRVGLGDERWEFRRTDGEVVEREDLMVQIEENVECAICKRVWVLCLLARSARQQRAVFGQLAVGSKEGGHADTVQDGDGEGMEWDLAIEEELSRH